jgi:predicted dehydrogenase
MTNVGIIGLGYWGPNLVRNFNALGTVNVSMVADLDAERREKICKMYPNTMGVASGEDILNNPEIDAVVLATPIKTHYNLAKKALEMGKHVLVEKPLATSRAEAQELIDLAKQKGLALMVDHTFLYTGAVQKIKDLVQSGEIGELQYFDSTRVNLGLFNPNYSVAWDLAVHDLSIFDYISNGKQATAVSATGISHTALDIEDISYITLHFADKMMAHITSSWISPVKIRSTLIGGTKKMVIYDDVEPTEKIKIYDSGFTVTEPEEMHKFLIDYRFGDIHIPKIAQTEALLGVAKDFISAVTTGSTPLSNAETGLRVVAILEAAQKSMAQRGAVIDLQ